MISVESLGVLKWRVLQRLQYITPTNAKNPSTVCVASIVKAAPFKNLLIFG
jgi:hypothetical protein